MRRVILVLLVVLLVPSFATAAQYRCIYDGTVRSSCCCPTPKQRAKTPAANTSIKAACCCEITQIAAASSQVRIVPRAIPSMHPALVIATIEVTPPVAPQRATTYLRPRAAADPPEALFRRHCSLLL